MEWKWTWHLDISPQLLETIRSLPVHRSVTHCGETFVISPFDIYAACPRCATRFKVRSFAGITELEDVFDAVFTWMRQPGAEEIVRQRQQVLKEEED
jgi:hypothetical protein